MIVIALCAALVAVIATDGRMAIAAIAQGVALLEEAAGPSPWNGILKEEAR